MNLDEPLGGKDLVKTDSHAVQDTKRLRLRLPAGGGTLLGELGAAEPELAAGDDLLLDEATYELAGRSLTRCCDPRGRGRHFAERPDLLLYVSDCRIGIEPGLVGTAHGRIDLRGGLPECGIAFQRDPLKVGQSHRGHCAVVGAAGCGLSSGRHGRRR